jgi:hypothetical protein
MYELGDGRKFLTLKGGGIAKSKGISGGTRLHHTELKFKAGADISISNKTSHILIRKTNFMPQAC